MVKNEASLIFSNNLAASAESSAGREDGLSAEVKGFLQGEELRMLTTETEQFRAFTLEDDVGLDNLD